jgi:hypothetical protein
LDAYLIGFVSFCLGQYVDAHEVCLHRAPN